MVSIGISASIDFDCVQSWGLGGKTSKRPTKLLSSGRILTPKGFNRGSKNENVLSVT